MSKFNQKILKTILILALLAGVGYVYRAPLYRIIQNVENRLIPCSQPITYKLGNFDNKFGISKSDFLKAISQAEGIWETSINKNLFEYSEKGNMTINLIYDYRQEATQKLQSLGITINEDEATYNMLKAKYGSLVTSYNQQKASLDPLIKTFQIKNDAYEKEVAYWNRKGGAPKLEYDKLKKEEEDLNSMADEINRIQDNLNKTVDNINAVANVLNRLVAQLNITANKYNSIGTQQGGEFEEGQYVSNASGIEINIFQFDNRDKLIRVLVHELGHALGLGHLDNPKAIMYSINEGVNLTLTVDDLDALKQQCRIR